MLDRMELFEFGFDTIRRQAEVPYQFSRSVSILVFKNRITQRININF
jgi:hypothetical protein